MWTKRRVEALDSVQLLQAVLADEAADEARLISAYLDAKRCLATAYATLFEERLGASTALSVVIDAVRSQARRFTGIPAGYLDVRGYGKSHRLIFAYLSGRLGCAVSSNELRILTGDAVHTERRARDLRHLGLELEARPLSGTSSYKLISAQPNLISGARYHVKRNISKDKSLRHADRQRLINVLEQQSSGP